MILARCPDRDLLSDYCVGRLSATQLEEIASHVESCGDCQAELMTLDDTADTLVGGLRAAGEKSHVNEPILEVAMAQALKPWCAGADLAERVQQAAQVVAPSHVPGHVRSAGSHSPQPAAQPQRSRARRWATVGGLLLLMAASFGAGVLITIYRNGRSTQVEVPEGSQLRVNAKGDVDVTLPSAAAAAEGGDVAANDLQALQGVRTDEPLPTNMGILRLPSDLIKQVGKRWKP